MTISLHNKLSSSLTFSDEQAMLLDTATEFFRNKSPVAVVREQLTTENGFDEAVWQEIVALGWTGLAIPENYGGSELGLAAAVCIAEPMGQYLSATPFLSTQLFIQGVMAGSDSQKSTYLTAIAEGGSGTVALFEDDGSWDLSGASLAVVESGSGLKLSGVKTFVVDAAVADYLLVSGALKGKPCLVVLEKSDLPAGALQRETVIDETRRSYRLTLDNLTVPADRLIKGKAAIAGLDQIRNAALLLISAESTGGIEGALQVIVEYLNTRTAFGKKIGSYQGLKHPSAQILIDLERSRSHVYHAASLIDAGEDAEIALRMAKAHSSDSLAFAGDRAIQFHGGFGFTYECDGQLYLRRGLWNQYAFGDAVHQRKKLEGLLF